MPGIYGIIAKKKTTQQELGNYLQVMTGKLKHQDWYDQQQYIDENIALGSLAVRKRFDILPVKHNDQEYVAAIEGYIYRLKEKRTDTFTSPYSDITVKIVEILNRDSQSGLTDIEGNYVIAVYNKSLQRFSLFNDIIGPRRIYIADLSDFFVFAPEVKAISMLPFFKKDIDLKGMADFLNYGYILGEETFFTTIRSLPSASLITMDLSTNTVSRRKYWLVAYKEKKASMNDLAEETCDLLYNSLDEKIHDRDSLLSPISGGLDSRMILGMLNTVRKNFTIKPITYGQKFSDEYKYARNVCQTLNLPNHQLIEIKPELLIEKYVPAVWYNDGLAPMNNSHLLIFPEVLGTDYDYLFNGIYGGPTNYSAEYYRSEHITGNYTFDQKVPDITKVISLDTDTYTPILSETLLKQVTENRFSSIGNELKKYLAVSDKFCNQRDAFFIENRMRRSICQGALYRFFWEEQLPLSNYSLYKFYLSTPPDLKLHRVLLKTALIRKFPRLAAIPDANTGLNLYQQPSDWYKQKQKLHTDLKYYINRMSGGKIIFYDRRTYAHHNKWFQQHEPTYQFFQKWLRAENSLDSGFLNTESIDKELSKIRKSGIGLNHLVRVVTLLIWYQVFYLEQGITDIQSRLKLNRN